MAYSYFGNDPEYKIIDSKIRSFRLKLEYDSLRSEFENGVGPFIDRNDIPQKVRYPLYFYGFSFDYDYKDWRGREKTTRISSTS